MKREIITTADGSKTIHLPDWNEQYHSKHGAINEAYHVFIKNGLNFVLNKYLELQHIDILEIGFGTGLNAFITLLEGEKQQKTINYVGVEAFPVNVEEINQLNYSKQLNLNDRTEDYLSLHNCDWESFNQINNNFRLKKEKKSFLEIKDSNVYNIIYFDAFGPRVQPELWTEDVFSIMYKALREKGVLVTYSAKGSVRRAMQTVGFKVERLPGPPGKREMLRAIKIGEKS